MSRDVRLLTNRDIDSLQGLLRQNVQSCLFMLSNLVDSNTQVEFSGKRYEGRYCGVFEQGDLVAVVVQYWNGNVMACGMTEDLLTAWQVISPMLDPVKGFVGDSNACQLLLQEYDKSLAKPLAFSLASNEVLYRLALADMRIPERLKGSDFTVRLATMADETFLLPWMVDYNIAALNAVRSDAMTEQVLTSIRHRMEAERTYVLWFGETPVATSSFNAVVSPYVQIGGVWTPPEFRGQGYAQMVVAGSLLHAKETGYQMSILFTDHGNVAARRAYERIGYQTCGEFGLYIV